MLGVRWVKEGVHRSKDWTGLRLVKPREQKEKESTPSITLELPPRKEMQNTNREIQHGVKISRSWGGGSVRKVHVREA